MTCAQCRDLFSPAWDQTLPLARAAELRGHLASCAVCEGSFTEFRMAMEALSRHAPSGPVVGEAFTQAVLGRVRAHPSALRPWWRWGGLAAAALLLAAGLGIAIRMLPEPSRPSREGFRVFRALSQLEEPYHPGDSLQAGDIVVADRGGRIPMGGRLVPLGPGGIAWVPGKAEAPERHAPPAQLVVAFADDRGVQVLSGDAGIAWRVAPSQRRRYLHELVDLSEGRDPQAALLARQELERVLGPGQESMGDVDSWRLAMAEPPPQAEEWGGVLPMVERSAWALGGPEQHVNLSTVSRAMGRTVALVGERYVPSPVARWIAPASEEGS